MLRAAVLLTLCVYLVKARQPDVADFNFQLEETGSPIPDEEKQAFLAKIDKTVVVPDAIKDALVPIFLKARDHNIDEAAELMENAATFYHENKGKLLGQSVSPKAQEVNLKTKKVVTLLPNRADGKRVILMQMQHWKHADIKDKSFTLSDIFRQVYLLHLAIMHEPETQDKGVDLLIDYENADSKIQRTLIKHIAAVAHMMSFFKHSMPLKCNSINIFNAPTFVSTVINQAQNIFTKKDKIKVNFHKGIESLHQSIPKSGLPTQYGGDLDYDEGSYSIDHWYSALAAHENWIQEWEAISVINT